MTNTLIQPMTGLQTLAILLIAAVILVSFIGVLLVRSGGAACAR